MTVNDVYLFIDSFAPFSSQAAWDNSGLLIGDAGAEVSRAVVALDVTPEVLEQARKSGANLIISHHPVIFKPQKSFLSGDICYSAAAVGVNVICAHTNLDKAPGGVNDTLCEVLGLKYEKLPDSEADGFLNIGLFNEPRNAHAFARLLKNRLGGSVRFCDAGKDIMKIAVCSGAGGDFVTQALRFGCDALVTGEAGYHDFLCAAGCGLSVFAAGHFETEVIIVKKLIALLSERFNSVVFIESDEKSPIVTEN